MSSLTPRGPVIGPVEFDLFRQGFHLMSIAEYACG
jgi:hypothetical protein